MRKIIIILITVGVLILLRNLAYDFQEYIWKLDNTKIERELTLK